MMKWLFTIAAVAAFCFAVGNWIWDYQYGNFVRGIRGDLMFIAFLIAAAGARQYWMEHIIIRRGEL